MTVAELKAQITNLSDDTLVLVYDVAINQWVSAAPELASVVVTSETKDGPEYRRVGDGLPALCLHTFLEG